jgi:hypothetical protein
LEYSLENDLEISHTIHTVVFFDPFSLQREKVIRKMMLTGFRVESRPLRILAIILAEEPAGPLLLEHKLLQLEAILRAKLNGLGDHERIKLLSRSHNPKEIAIIYDPPSSISNTPLFQELQSLDTEKIMRAAISEYQHTLTELGACAAEMVWFETITAADPATIEGRFETTTSAEIRELVKNWHYEPPNLDIASHNFNVVPKFIRLLQVLQSCEHYGAELRAVVFGRCNSRLLWKRHTKPHSSSRGNHRQDDCQVT